MNFDKTDNHGGHGEHGEKQGSQRDCLNNIYPNPKNGF